MIFKKQLLKGRVKMDYKDLANAIYPDAKPIEYYEEKYVFNKEELPEIKLALLGNDAGIIGATLI